MFFSDLVEPSYEVYQKRRIELAKKVKKENNNIENGLIVIFASFEDPDVPFEQDSTFYYLTGLEDSGFVMTIDMDGKSNLFVPNCVEFKKKWTGNAIEPSKEVAKKLSVENIEFLGDEFKDVYLRPYFDEKLYSNLTKKISDVFYKDGKIFVLDPKGDCQDFYQRFALDRVKSFLPDWKKENIVDVSSIIAKMRRKKDVLEIGQISDAIGVTALAHASAAGVIEDGVTECEVQAAAEYIFIVEGVVPAYSSIVASGKNAIILHPKKNCGQMEDGQLVIVDVGAKLDHYCADITRTYPVSGKFSKRQRELYNIVLATQKYIAGIVKPGYFLRNDKQKEKCLQNLAIKFLDSQGGYGKYFTHGIGHFLGLDVHDVGKKTDPLHEGDVITIEPGIYIPEEGVGIRIEDDFWITKNKAVCLSDDIPREIDDVEKFMENIFPEV